MALVEICPNTFITEDCFDRLIAAAAEADKITPEDCVIAADCTDEELTELLSKEPRPALDVTGLSRERMRTVLFGSST